ncbi:2-isopropylmalate synthase [Serpentinicella alkaliphila]|uniref:2-isopropylmalate synthase n=1 Tax=Serpentinicella alkaliphila TaxID=1734049 RepID=A0A4V2T475_9FIRM|nr:2-isopropylmalate synthase [Serpentinicella alkaliphila]QUH24452.1 2-isopropylmalate synthase [Serpentinicella alkaliphila]TCQ04154.1 2-isopropylmalate synthase [Serpentinicella alkaliphila]
MARAIKIFDTTLRDGEQSPGCSMNIKEKIEIAKQLEKMGVDVIEAGFAIVSPGDFASVKAVAKTIKNAAVASLCRAMPKDIDRAYEALKYAQQPRIHTFIATSDIHMKYKLRASEDEVLETAINMVKYAKKYCSDVEFSAEDASRSNPEFLFKVFEGVIKAGATVINVPDTVGYTVPDEYYNLIRSIRENVSNIDKAEISVHCHNDLGMAVANTLAAARAGATQLECTINGIGERAGNAAMEEIVMALNTRKDFYGLASKVDTTQIYAASQLLTKITGMKVQHNKAIVGKNAFAHEAGIHQHGVLANSSTYEIMTPESIGLTTNSLVLGKHSGRHAFESRLNELGYTLSQEQLDKIFENFKELTDKKKVIYDKDLEALIQEKAIEVIETCKLNQFTINCGNTITSTATVNITKNNQEFEEVSLGHGPIDAAFKAIEKIVDDRFDLEDYSLNSITEGEDAQGEAIVKIRRYGRLYTGRGISTDVIEASIKAYINAINKMLNDSEQQEV